MKKFILGIILILALSVPAMGHIDQSIYNPSEVMVLGDRGEEDILEAPITHQDLDAHIMALQNNPTDVLAFTKLIGYTNLGVVGIIAFLWIKFAFGKLVKLPTKEELQTIITLHEERVHLAAAKVIDNILKGESAGFSDINQELDAIVSELPSFIERQKATIVQLANVNEKIQILTLLRETDIGGDKEHYASLTLAISNLNKEVIALGRSSDKIVFMLERGDGDKK